MTSKVGGAFSDELATGLRASIISKLAVMVTSFLMFEKPVQGTQPRNSNHPVTVCCPLTTSNAAAELPR